MRLWDKGGRILVSFVCGDGNGRRATGGGRRVEAGLRLTMIWVEGGKISFPQLISLSVRQS